MILSYFLLQFILCLYNSWNKSLEGVKNIFELKYMISENSQKKLKNLLHNNK